MLLTIYDKAGAKRADVAASDSSTQSKEVQGDNVLALSFTHYAHIPLDVGDFTDYMGERYWLTERYTPKEKSGSEWEYNLKLYGIESLIRRFLVLETTDGDTNPLFTLTATPRDHVAMVVKAINKLRSIGKKEEPAEEEPTPTAEELLTEIRDLLKENSDGSHTA